jgi:hypothetical protein
MLVLLPALPHLETLLIEIPEVVRIDVVAVDHIIELFEMVYYTFRGA